MWTKWRRPWYERTALRQTEVTEHLLVRAGLADRLSDNQVEALALTLHTGYGVTLGALYGLLAGRSRLPAFLSGGLWGATVWSGSYLGWVPRTKLGRSARKDPPEMTATLLSSNVLWGIITGLSVAAMAPAHALIQAPAIPAIISSSSTTNSQVTSMRTASVV